MDEVTGGDKDDVDKERKRSYDQLTVLVKLQHDTSRCDGVFEAARHPPGGRRGRQIAQQTARDAPGRG